VTTENAGLLAAATDAFVDRTPIDWRALRARTRDPHDRALVDTLHTLDLLRQGTAPAVRAPDAPRRARLVRLLIALTALQTIVSLALAAPSIGSSGATRFTAQAALTLAFAAAAAVLALGATHDQRRLYLIAMLLCSASSFARGALNVQPASASGWTRGLWLEVFAPACMWQFALDFPRVRRFAWFDVVARRVATVVWTLAAAAFALSAAVAAGMVADVSVAAFLPNHRSNFFWRGYTVAMILAVASIFIRSRRAPALERRRVVRFASALAAGAAPFLLLGIARTLVPGVDRWLLAATPAARFWIDAIVVSALLATPILMSAAVVVDRPFDVQRVAAEAWRRARRKAAIWSARRHRRLLSQTLQRLRHARSVRDVSQIAAEAIATGLDAAVVRVLIPNGVGTFGDCLGSSVAAPANAAFTAMLHGSTQALDLRPGGAVHLVLPASERAWLAAEGIQMAAAIATRTASPVAIVVAGNRDGSVRLERRDLWFIEAIVAAASSAWSAALASADDERARPVSVSGSTGELAFECPACGLVQAAVPLTCACDRSPLLSALPARVGGSFEVRRRLGAGGMGVVYLARDVRLDRDVALKTLPAIGPSTIAQLQVEAKAMAALSHDALATIYGLEMWRDLPVLVVEHLPGGTLARRLCESGPMAPAAVIQLGITLARALDAMHQAGVLHGDLKPANVAFTARSDPKLLDFGLSRIAAVDRYDLRRRAPAGTLAYLSPEALAGEAPSFALDLWSLAVVLLECVTGRNPFARDTHALTRQAILAADAGELCAPARAAHPPLAALLERALGAREVRFATAALMQSALEDLARALPRHVE
jgi:hypothetical protein